MVRKNEERNSMSIIVSNERKKYTKNKNCCKIHKRVFLCKKGIGGKGERERVAGKKSF